MSMDITNGLPDDNAVYQTGDTFRAKFEGDEYYFLIIRTTYEYHLKDFIGEPYEQKRDCYLAVELAGPRKGILTDNGKIPFSLNDNYEPPKSPRELMNEFIDEDFHDIRKVDLEATVKYAKED